MQLVNIFKIGFLILVLTIVNSTATSQPTLSERYETDTFASNVFGSVIATDSCYYVIGTASNNSSYSERRGIFAQIGFNGNIQEINYYHYDTIGFDFWQGKNMIQTLDDNFAWFSITKGDSSYTQYYFFKVNTEGDTINTSYLNFYNENLNIGRNPSTLTQAIDSSFYGLVTVVRESDNIAGVVCFRLDKTGQLIWYKEYYADDFGTYNFLISCSLLKYAPNKIILGSSYRKTSPSQVNVRMHNQLLVIDTLGNILEEHLYDEDRLGVDCNSLIQTIDDGFLYCGRNGLYYEPGDHNSYHTRIVKLNSDFDVDWIIGLPDSSNGVLLGLNKIIPVSETEFVVVGHTTDYDGEKFNSGGRLLKFNLEGDIIWLRKYMKLPSMNINPPDHRLYDVDQTVDSGFVMVGQAINYYDNEFVYGQKAWLVKTDKHGCLVPDCHLNDNPPNDTVVPVIIPQNRLYPNPATNVIFYYHYQQNFQNGTAYIYNTAGQVVQKWEVTENEITYEIDISHLAAGTYIVKVFNALGEPLETERFVKV